MREYLYQIEDDESDESEVFIGWIRRHGKERIRCKDCKHWLPHTQFGYDADYEEYHNYCNRHLPDDDFYAFIKEEDDFCSWAERKEE